MLKRPKPDPAWTTPIPGGQDPRLADFAYMKAQTLFEPCPGGDTRHTDRGYEGWREAPDTYRVQKEPYTEKCYTVHLGRLDGAGPSCNCICFAGKEEGVYQDGSVKPAVEGRGYCKHVWAVELGLGELESDPELGPERVDALLDKFPLHVLLQSWRKKKARDAAAAGLAVPEPDEETVEDGPDTDPPAPKAA